MKQLKIIETYKILEKYKKEPWSLPSSRKLYDLKTRLQKEWDFQYEEEQKLLDELQPEITEEGMKFASTEDADKYRNLIKELSDMDVEIEGLPVHIPDAGNEKVHIPTEDIEKLEGFVKFYGED